MSTTFRAHVQIRTKQRAGCNTNEEVRRQKCRGCMQEIIKIEFKLGEEERYMLGKWNNACPVGISSGL